MSINATAKNPVIIPPEKQAPMKALTTISKVARPSVALSILVIGGVVATDYALFMGMLVTRSPCC